ncbi:MAG: hypothetical protein B7X82_10465 [Hydrogenophilales bacterium 17-64-65]|nr:MAG: hypothetical protein B7Y27_15170 [Hydrogenophilales bacterium 16-64-40]OZA33151.1 MAG: hypothetical protein B7X82_10465 [Hydrogenophilales bacterium 17-64-65]
MASLLKARPSAGGYQLADQEQVVGIQMRHLRHLQPAEFQLPQQAVAVRRRHGGQRANIGETVEGAAIQPGPFKARLGLEPGQARHRLCQADVAAQAVERGPREIGIGGGEEGRGLASFVERPIAANRQPDAGDLAVVLGRHHGQRLAADHHLAAVGEVARIRVADHADGKLDDARGHVDFVKVDADVLAHPPRQIRARQHLAKQLFGTFVILQQVKRASELQLDPRAAGFG